MQGPKKRTTQGFQGGAPKVPAIQGVGFPDLLSNPREPHWFI